MKWTALWNADLKLTASRLPLLLFGVAAIFIMIAASLPASLFRSLTPENISIALVSRANPLLTRMLAGMAADYDLVRQISIEADEETADEKLESGLADVVLIIPDNVERALMYGEPVTVRVKANDAFLGTIAYRFTGVTVDTINAVESVTSGVYERIRESGLPGEEASERMLRFANEILIEAVTRNSYLDDISAASPYQTHVVSLIQCLLSAIAAVFAAVTASGQIAGGYLRRIMLRGLPAWQLLLVKLSISCVLSVLLGAALLVGFHALGIEPDALRYLCSAALLSLLFTGLCFSVMSLGEQRESAAAGSLLRCVALLFLLLFWGGGLYPAYLMDTSFRVMNPVWLSHLLAGWSMAGAAPSAGALAPYPLLLALCVGVSAFRWGRSVRG